VIEIAGRWARRGLVFEGDRRFQIVVRLADASRNGRLMGLLENLPVTLPPASSGETPVTIPLRQLASFQFTEGPKSDQ